jgi:mannose-6-phosphate isomerase-like protein (cupin superfamily)
VPRRRLAANVLQTGFCGRAAWRIDASSTRYPRVRNEGSEFMDHEIRRVVTAHDETGKAIILLDGAPPSKVMRQSTGTTSWLVWAADAIPVDMSRKEDQAVREIGIPPPPGGAVFRIVDFPPTPKDVDLAPGHLAIELGDAYALSGHWLPRHPFMHRTRSLDFAVVLSGEIDMLLDDSEVRVTAGDVVVQQGTNHAWVNRGTVNCRIAFVMIDADKPDAGSKLQHEETM